METSRERLLREVERYLELTGMPAPEFGRAALNDSRFVYDLRGKRSPRLDTADKVRAYMAGERGEASA